MGEKSGVEKLSDNVSVYCVCYSNILAVLWHSLRVFKQIFKENRIDIISTQDIWWTGLIGYILKRRFGVPLHVLLAGDDLGNAYWRKESLFNRILEIIGKFVVKRADSARVVSTKIQTYLTETIRLPKERVFLVPVFTNIQKFVQHNGSAKTRARYSNFKGIVLFVGRLIASKNVSMLLKAATIVLEKHPDTLFLIVGDGVERQKLELETKELNLEGNVLFTGMVNIDDVVNYFHASDIFVLPSKYEGRALVVTEALACAKPVIASDVSGISDVIIDSENGYIVPIDDWETMGYKIIYLLDHPQLREEMGEKGRKVVLETHDIYKNARKYAEVFEITLKLAKSRMKEQEGKGER